MRTEQRGTRWKQEELVRKPLHLIRQEIMLRGTRVTAAVGRVGGQMTIEVPMSCWIGSYIQETGIQGQGLGRKYKFERYLYREIMRS